MTPEEHIVLVELAEDAARLWRVEVPELLSPSRRRPVVACRHEIVHAAAAQGIHPATIGGFLQRDRSTIIQTLRKPKPSRASAVSAKTASLTRALKKAAARHRVSLEALREPQRGPRRSALLRDAVREARAMGVPVKVIAEGLGRDPSQLYRYRKEEHDTPTDRAA